ncbi:MAG: GWxTD domain-containing protein [Melioribacteraceae bacterium]|nr:GWxTD domain-containing protein [Melioribacteraceae bacterium]
MMRRLTMKFFFLLIFISYSVLAQVEYSHGIVPPGEYPGFYIDAANYKGDSPEITRIDVYFQIPYANLQFVKFQNKFRAKYSLTLTIYDEDKDKIVIEKTWNGKIVVNNFDEASSENNFKFGFKSFELPPNDYVLSCLLYDKDSKKDFSVEAKMEVRSFNKSLEFSDILLISSEIDNQIILNVSNAISSSDSSLFFFYELYSDKDDSVNLEYLVETVDGEIVLQQKEVVEIESGINQIKKELDNSDISLGQYKLTVKAVDSDEETISGTAKIFVSKIFGFPSSIINLDKAIEQMAYIATTDERDDMLETENFDDKMKKYKEFWKRQDPSPTTTQNEVLREYYRRVSYANKNFKHYFEGWKTDMGMIYIILGPPDNVDRYPFEYDSKPYEVWHYYNINQSFYFIDETGFGDYRLLNRNYGDWYRYRQ